VVTTRTGGVSEGEYGAMNVGKSSGDAPENVVINRQRLVDYAGKPMRWLHQVHGHRAVDASTISDGEQADAQHTCGADLACVVMIADCMPVLFAAADGSCVAAAHAGWRGMSHGVLENTIAAMKIPAAQISAWMGPCIGPLKFEVGEDVLAAFCDVDPAAKNAFSPRPDVHGKYLCDLPMLARMRLRAAGVEQVYGGSYCTMSAPTQFFSYRRVQKSGRMAAAIWKTTG
jgi:polyphenol oxidase